MESVDDEWKELVVEMQTHGYHGTQEKDFVWCRSTVAGDESLFVVVFPDGFVVVGSHVGCVVPVGR